MHCNHLLIRNWKVKGSTVNSRLRRINVSTKQSAVFDLKSMSFCQCCAWGCHNRKGRCPENVEGVRICGCPELFRSKSCPKSFDLLTLHCIAKMAPNVQKNVIKRNKQFKLKNSWGCRPLHSNYLGICLGLEEPSLKLLHSAKLQSMNFSPISNCWRSKSAIFFSRNIKIIV